MKRIFLIFISVAMLFTSSGLVLAEEAQVVASNLKNKELKEVMDNTVIIRPNALEAFVYGKKYSLEDYGEAKREDNSVYVSSDFLREIFPDKTVKGKECGIFEFADENNMKAEEIEGTIYLSAKNYQISSQFANSINKFLGIYVKAGAKGVGTFESPVGSIASAKNIVSELKKSVGLPDGGITVYFREGKYVINNTVNFIKEDSGEEGSPIIYRAYKNEDVAFDGGVTVKGSEFSEITDVNIKKKLPYSDKVVAVNLSSKISGFSDSFKGADPSTWSVFYNDEALNVARWPDNDYTLTGEVLDDGGKKRGVGFSFVIGDSRIKKWVNEDDPRIFGYFGFDWAGERRKIASVDTQKLSITTDDFAEYGISSGKRYYVYNMVCELDSPGEFYYDNKTNYLYLYPVEGSPDSTKFLNNEVQFSLLSQTMFSLNETSYVEFQNVTFENSLDLGMNIAATCNNVAIKGCAFKNIAKGIDVYGFNNTVVGCDFYNISNRPLGANGGDRNTLTPSGNVITNNKFWNFNISSRTNVGAVYVKGCGDVISHNEIINSPHTAMVMGGNDNIIEYNELYNNLVDRAHDAGMLYSGRNLSEQGNIIRNNYFHDAAFHSIGVIYFDDGMSGNYVDSNVFENTGTGVFIHGGVATEVTNNLFLNGTGTGVGASSYGGSWKMETATSLPANTLLWNLKQFPYESEIWQTKYKSVLKYLESDENPIKMYDTVITGNTVIGKNDLISAPEKDIPYMTIENNTVMSAQEAENYEIPEKYREIMENAGTYIDEYRTEMDGLSEFNLLRPYHKENDVEASEVRFEWESSSNARGYQFTLATDKDFKNIISNKIVENNYITLQKLNYFNTRYYWKVKAIVNDTNSVAKDTQKACKQDYYSFTTKAYEVISREKLYEQIEICENTMLEVSEGDNPGDYKEGTLQAMNELVDKYKKEAAKETITQKEVNSYTEALKSEFNKLTYRKNPEMFDMAKAIGFGNLWNFTPNQTVFGTQKLAFTNQSSSTLGSAEKISPHITYKFKFKWDGYDLGWMGIGILAQGSPTAVPWSGNPMYFMIFKKDTVEFQKWGSGENLNNSYPNIYTKNGEWAEFEFSALAQDDGSNLVTWKMNGQTVVEYTDSDNPINTPGFLYFFNGTKDTTVEIMPSEEATGVAEEE